jgi:tetratricopeptide (TPR) repeat protein
MIVAEILLQRGDPRGAVLQAQKALYLGPLRPDHEALYAWLLYRRAGGGAYVPACTWQHLVSALERDPDCERAHRYQGLLLKRRGDLVLAKQHLARAAALNPDNAETQRELAELNGGAVAAGGQR